MKVNTLMYKNSSIFSKLYGLVYSDKTYNGIHYEKLVERDFHDLLFQYGIIAFVLELILPLYLIFKIIKKNILSRKLIIDEEVFVLTIGICLVLLGSYLAGHFLFSPAVSIYVAYSIALLYKKVGIL